MKKYIRFLLGIPTQLAILTFISTALILTIINSSSLYLNQAGGYTVGIVSLQFIANNIFDAFMHLEFWIAILFPTMSVFVFTQILLHPLKDMVKISQKIDSGSLDVRFEDDIKVSEFLVLSKVANQMLDQLEGAFNQQKLAYQQQGRFISNAAHELRTPLSIMRSNLEAIKSSSSNLDEGFHDWVAIQEKSLYRLEKLVEDLLVLAKQGGFTKEDLTLGVLLEEVVAEYKLLADKKEVTFSLAGDAEISVKGDEGLLMQVFSNLIENAIYYNKLGGKVIITLSQKENNAIIKISDTGIGIAEEDQLLIFERLYRVDQSRAHNDSGAGLGLSIVAHILKHHNGTIIVESELGEGTTFTVSLPIS